MSEECQKKIIAKEEKEEFRLREEQKLEPLRKQEEKRKKQEEKQEEKHKKQEENYKLQKEKHKLQEEKKSKRKGQGT